MSRPIDADAIPYTMLYKENLLKGTGVEKLGVWKDTIDAMPTIEPDWTELMVICDNCGHAIHAKRTDAKPIIEPERKKGKWIKVNGKTAINCSICYHCSWSLSFENTVKRFNFCPNCGADMRRRTE